jgi:hypothetical protein
VEVGQVPVPLVEIEAVADEEFVRNGEPDVPERQVVDEPAVRAVEERRGGEGARLAQAQRLHQPVQRQTGVHDVLDQQDVLTGDVGVEVLEQADRALAARSGAAVARELDEVEAVRDRRRPRQVGEEDEARLQQSDEEGLAARVVLGDPRTELGDTRGDLVGGEIELADRGVAGYEARSSLYLCARRSMSRL